MNSGTTTKISLVFLGTGPVAAESLKHLAQHFNIEAVITKPKPAHHKYDAPVELLAGELNLRVIYAGNKNDLDSVVDSQKFSSPIGVVVDYGVIISAKTIAHFPFGIINSHFSLLPQWRGADPISFSILSGQLETGVSLMVIDEGLDTGKLITQKSVAISPTETTPSLTAKLISVSNQLLAEYLPLYLSGEAALYDQPYPDQATYSRKLTKADGILDFSKPADLLEREIRAYIEWPRSRTILHDKDVIVTKAHVENHELIIDRLQPAGKREMSLKEFLAGIHK